MSNHMKFCGCMTCRCGRHTRWGKAIVKGVVRKFRRKSKQQLRKGETPDNKFSVPYTD